MIGKLKTFIGDFSFDSKLFDAETAINVCKESGYVQLAIDLAEKSRNELLYLKLLIEDQKGYELALAFI